MKRRATQAEIAQLVLDTPGLVTRIAINCANASPALQKLSQDAQLDAFNELRAIMQAELERIVKVGP